MFRTDIATEDRHAMNPPSTSPATDAAATATAAAAPDRLVPHLVAEVYECAPAAERGHLLEQLLQPLGVLSLFGVAGGVFANVRFRGGWPDPKIRLEDLHNIRSDHVVALVDYAQQVSVEAVDGLAQLLAGSPLMSSSAAAMLVTVLVQRARKRRGEGNDGAGSAIRPD
jgi:hypothetical protein